MIQATQQSQMGWVCPQCRKGVNPSTLVCPCAGAAYPASPAPPGWQPPPRYGPPTAAAAPGPLFGTTIAGTVAMAAWHRGQVFVDPKP